MPIYRLLQKSHFEPEDIQIFCAAYEEIVASLPVAGLSESLPERIARKIIALGQAGERDKATIVNQVISELGLRKSPGQCG